MNRDIEPLISVIVPVYGTEKYLRKCLDSILGQTYRNIELIIVNDGTEDNSENIIMEYMRRFGNIKYVRHKKNKGLFRARVSGAEEATGKYIAFVDSDDYISGDFYRVLIKTAEDRNSDIVVANTVFEDADGKKEIKLLHRLCFGKDLLSGEEIKEKFFSQQGYCFSWHSIWNKIYRKSLWDRCMPYYRKITCHLIMTEDIAFSVPLLYFADSLAVSQSVSYFYCQTPNASTSSADRSYKKFRKNIQDLTTAFNFAEDFLRENNAAEIEQFRAFREKYSRMYRSTQVNNFPQAEAVMLMDSFLPDYRKKQREDEFFFDNALNLPFNDGINYARELICSDDIRVISFDLFDTLVTRPFYRPADLFDLLNVPFDEMTDNRYNIEFSEIRKIAEKTAREKISESTNSEDLTLSEIYRVIKEDLHIDSSVADAMYRLENQYEINYSRTRNSAKELYDLACYLGKRIVITSDMYLEYDTVEKILKKNGYSRYERIFLSSKERSLKYTGNLFKRMLKYVQLSPGQVLHIGDTYRSDIDAAKKLGIKTFFLPKGREIFENIIDGIKTNNCAWTEKYIFAPFNDPSSARTAFVYRTMLALVANKFFDDPYTSFDPESDFNGNPYMLGYYAVGMHCVGLAKWLCDSCRKLGYKNIYFLERDGYLPKTALDIYQKNLPDKINTHMLYGSRRFNLPFMINEKADLYRLPIEKNNHSPLSLSRLLDFCLEYDGSLEETLSRSNFAYDARFKSETELYSFITYIAENLFSPEKLAGSQKALSEYYSCIKEDSVLFDMGYSGRIQQAISRAISRPIDAFYVHMDNDKSFKLTEKFRFSIYSYYNGIPSGSNIIRELLLSSDDPQCIKVATDGNGDLSFTMDSATGNFPEKFIIDTVQRGAIDFIRDFTDLFSDRLTNLAFNTVEVSAPFEYFLRFAKTEDIKFLNSVGLEDICYGNISSVRADRLFNNQLCDMPAYEPVTDSRNRSHMSLAERNFDEIDSYAEDVNIPYQYRGKRYFSPLAIFMDMITPDDSPEDKFAKCVGNTGNLIDWYYINHTFCPTLIPGWYVGNPDDLRDNGFDTFFTTGLGRVEENTDLSYLIPLLEKLGDKVLFPLGVGFTTPKEKKNFCLSNESVKALRLIAERCKSVGVSGEYSAQVLSDFGIKNTEIIGSPSVYFRFEQMKEIEKNSEILRSVASFRPFYGEFSQSEKQILLYMMNNKSELVDTTPLELKRENLHSKRLFGRIKTWESTKKIFFDTEEWMNFLSKSDFAYGLNFQNNILAMQCGVPALFINYESVGRELCRFYALPSVEISEFDTAKSLSEYRDMADLNDFTKLIDGKFKEYCDFLRKNNIEFFDISKRIVEQ